MYFFNMTMTQVYDLYISEFMMRAEQAINIGSFLASGKLEFQDSRAKRNLLRMQYEALKAKGFFGDK